MADTGIDFDGREHLLALADDEHLIGQQHTEWIGVAPFLEEDLAFASIAQDELGHAAALYEVIVGPGGDVDALAFGRPPDQYRSCHLVELPYDDWARALARHWLYDLAEALRWSALVGSTVAAVAALVARVQREESYHARHATALVERMLAGDAAERMRAGVADVLPSADAIWEPVAGEVTAIAAEVALNTSAELQARWRDEVAAVFGPVDWDGLARPHQGGRTIRSGAFAALHSRVTEVARLDPGARW